LEWAKENNHPNIVKLIEDTTRKRAAIQALEEKQQLADQLKNATLAQLLDQNDFSRETFVTALTDKLIDAKNQELPAFIAKSTVEQRTALLSTVEKRLAQAQATVLELNGRAEDAVRKGEDAAGFRRQVGKLQAYIAVLTDIKNILNQS
jgi:sulfur carrier protein ThiS